MKSVYQLVLLTAIFGCVASYTQILEEYGTTRIGERCERDRNCIRHAYCRAQMTCLCDPYYSPTLDKTMCIASAGLNCANDQACETMTNAECKQGACACKDSFMQDIRNSSNCIRRPVKEEDLCQRNDDCQDAMGRAMCINGRCRCITSYHFANETGKCVQTRFLYNACSGDYECVDFENEFVLQCRNGACVCKEGEPGCSGASYAVAGVGVVLSFFLQRLI
ncbi:prion-like-(Q/N-rich) domain-bearing protein 25 [Megachile rotundata]|uniref:prion-like-(Q/N-rich) domain-bearing protein 25 n=1 Tax=Megachile rotundata TaxID=143995 RepID=UPI000258E45D|nr:PREDICTED: tenascin-R-like [Megachile rotundata]